MTEKRFENRLNKDIKKFTVLNPVWDNKLETAWNVFEMIDLSNKYDKEYNICHNDVLRLEKENEQLKFDIKDCAKRYKGLFNKYIKLQKENKTLKQQLESEHTMLDNAILLERTRMGKNSLIQYREAIQ